MKLWIDDQRHPPSEEWSWVKTTQEAEHWLLDRNGQETVTHISFDNDLGLESEREGWELAEDLTQGLKLQEMGEIVGFLPQIEEFWVHSANPIAAGRMIVALTTTKVVVREKVALNPGDNKFSIVVGIQ